MPGVLGQLPEGCQVLYGMWPAASNEHVCGRQVCVGPGVKPPTTKSFVWHWDHMVHDVSPRSSPLQSGGA